jgi:hypothetical protein
VGGIINPWELLDNTANIIEVAGAAYLIYRNRGKLAQIAVKLKPKKPAVVVQMRTASSHVRAISATSTATASRSTEAPRRSAPDREPPGWEDLTLWYLQVRLS